MTRGGRRRTSSALTCLACGAILDTCRSFCDQKCKEYAHTFGYNRFAPKHTRGIPRKYPRKVT